MAIESQNIKAVPTSGRLTGRSSRQPYAPQLVVHALRALLRHQLLHSGLRLNSSVMSKIHMTKLLLLMSLISWSLGGFAGDDPAGPIISPAPKSKVEMGDQLATDLAYRNEVIDIPFEGVFSKAEGECSIAHFGGNSYRKIQSGERAADNVMIIVGPDCYLHIDFGSGQYIEIDKPGLVKRYIFKISQ